MKAPDLMGLLARLQAIEAEAERALEGMAEGRIPRGTTALVNVKHLAGDALAEAHQSGRLDYEPIEMP